ncbi:hypothetical protein J2X65_003176 [Ancylobacter sp. 3268]|uniref:DUF6551 family protein n=1 Tax=Ancylobacter sp. 3268 TaxID=2817752 RepID=UPI00285CE4C4|nr:DUF6551 family protein [Ancylobacter sp. 3268]MDR6953813.1 hypothetical protein [Ancylobacter sp. 3268]
MSGARRPIQPIGVPGIEPGGEPELAQQPEFRWVDPTTLFVDESYQRNLSERSVHLIRRIVADWDWRRFKCPIVVETPEGFDIIDGQHTAIAAATHPAISSIPIMIVEADSRAARALAFIGHNRDRIAVTATQMHFAAVAAEDPDAMTIDQVCRRANIRVLRVPPGSGFFKPGDTMAVGAIGRLINRRGAMKARQMLEILGAARMAPVSAAAVKAVEMLLTDPEYSGEVTPDAIRDVIMTLGPEAEKEAKMFAAAHSVPLWRALGVIWFKRQSRGRKRTS